MIANKNLAEKTKNYYDVIECIVDILIALVLAVVSLISLEEALEYFTENKCLIQTIAIIVIIITFLLYIFKIVLVFCIKRKTNEKYNREKKINQINGALFESLYRANSEKTREIFRYTYGNVPEWNPINYHDNVLVYDVHEQIRSILISLRNVVVCIDKERLNDRNVSVELIYRYLQNDSDMKLISSGDNSSNDQKVTAHFDSDTSFYYLLENCGTAFLNHKFEEINDNLVKPINKLNKEKIKKQTYFEIDKHDIACSKNGKEDGSAAGTVLCLRNDNPEEIFVKAYLTINTYGEPIFSANKKNDRGIDKFGLSLEDYSDLFKNRIISTYSKLLESELAQMYIRHSIREGSTCPKTGRMKCDKGKDCYKRCALSIICNCFKS